jgi:hypothetical protein
LTAPDPVATARAGAATELRQLDNGARIRTEGRVTSPAAPRPTASRLRTLVLIWAGWALLVLGYQAFGPARLPIQGPDYALPWTPDETRPDSHPDQPYVHNPFLAAQVAWDSQYYLSIALHGYDDPLGDAIAPGSTLGDAHAAPKGQHPAWIPVNSAFFPGYAYAMRLVAWPLRIFALDPVATASLAGVLVSLAGSLAAMIALSALADEGDPDERLRAAFYLLVWPASFFLIQVYSEGLFLALSFGALALLRRGRWVGAAALAVAATWTRATGALLIIPLAWAFVAQGGLRGLRRVSPAALGRLVLAVSPALAYAAWRVVFGARFSFIEENYFGRGMLWLELTRNSWAEALGWMRTGHAQSVAYYVVELAGILAAAGCSLALLRREPALALYSLAILGVALTSGAAQGMHRYVLSAPALFLAPARWGRSPVFDRLWVFAGTLGLAVFALAFSVDFWAG